MSRVQPKEVGDVTDISVRETDGVLEATFDRPTCLNAIRRQTLLQLTDILDRAAESDSVRVIVFTGRGRAFSAGQDLVELNSLLSTANGAGAAQVDALQEVTRQLIAHPKVTIAAINGVAVGFGAELAVACDLRIVAEAARLGFVEATRGLFQTNGVTWLLPRLVGHGRAADLLLSGELISGAEAHRIGLASRLVPDDQLLVSSRELATRLAANAPISLRLIKQAMRSTWGQDLDTAMAAEVSGMLECVHSDDLREGTTAFLEKRRAAYRGR